MLRRLQPQISAIFADGAPVIRASTLSSFRRDVLFVSLDDDSQLALVRRVRELVLRAWRSAGLEVDDQSTQAWKPHVTVMKLAKQKRRRNSDQPFAKAIPPAAYAPYKSVDLGAVVVPVRGVS